MDMEHDLSDLSLNPDHARKVAAILSIQPDDAQPLSQFSDEQRESYLWAVQQVHESRMCGQSRPEFFDEVSGRLAAFHETQKNHYHRLNTRAVVASGFSSPDPTDEWSQRVLVGVNRMGTDPEFHAFVQRRIS